MVTEHDSHMVSSKRARLFRLPRPLKHLLSRPHAKVSGRFVPEDIILEIAEHMDSPRDLLNLCLTVRINLIHIILFSLTPDHYTQSSHLYYLILPTLYTSVDLKSSEQCSITLSFLAQHPNIARRIRKLVIRPNHKSWATKERQLHELWVVNVLEKIAFNLRNLHTFLWDGNGRTHVRLWMILRKLWAASITFSKHDRIAH